MHLDAVIGFEGMRPISVHFAVCESSNLLKINNAEYNYFAA